jgi:hypothetical protein
MQTHEETERRLKRWLDLAVIAKKMTQLLDGDAFIVGNSERDENKFNLTVNMDKMNGLHRINEDADCKKIQFDLGVYKFYNSCLYKMSYISNYIAESIRNYVSDHSILREAATEKQNFIIADLKTEFLIEPQWLDFGKDQTHPDVLYKSKQARIRFRCKLGDDYIWRCRSEVEHSKLKYDSMELKMDAKFQYAL